MKHNDFDRLGVIEPIRRALREENISNPTPIQKEAIPIVLAGGDVMGSAQTGSGKTAAFALPMLQTLQASRTNPVRGSTRALILTPTRELADQVAECFSSFGRYLGLRVAAVYGGVSRNEQINILSKGVDVLVATPGRLMDLMEDRKVLLGRTEIFVLDEADRMLDMGFIPDIKKISAALPTRRQTLLFSATLPPMIMGLAANLLKDPQHIEIASSTEQDPQIEQKVMFVNRSRKNALLMRLLKDRDISRVLVFTRTKHKANTLSRQLSQKHINNDVLHSDKTQGARQKALQSFHDGRIRVLVATDIAARGIDVDDIDYVINYELPMEPELYVHRIGRTARAGKQGTALSFCDDTELKFLRQIEKVLEKQLPVWTEQPFHDDKVASRARGSHAKRNAAKNKSADRQPVNRDSSNRDSSNRSSSNQSSSTKNKSKSRRRRNKSRGRNRGWQNAKRKSSTQHASA
jgi:ATP-dependent RNA helicase RhlE